MRNCPVVLITCSRTAFEIPGTGPLYYQAVLDSYVEAIASALAGTPLLVPAFDGRAEALADCLRLADGVLLTGDPSNIGPEIYGGSLPEEPRNRDPYRDRTVLPLVRAAIADGLPLLGICRGIQEINVALGGTLHQRVSELPGRLDHGPPRDCAYADTFLPSHRLNVRKGSWLETILLARGIEPSNLRVNSLHGQSVANLGRSVMVEATADDGIVEAIRVANAPALAIGVQWHAERYIRETPLHAAIFDEFRKACLTRRR